MMRIVKLLIFFSFSAWIACQSNNASSEVAEESEIVLPAEEEDFEEARDKWGYIDFQGDLVIDAKYDDARDFSEGLAVVRQKGRWGFINKQGERNIIVDLSTVKYCDSSGLSALLIGDRLCKEDGVVIGKMMSSPAVKFKGKVFTFFHNEISDYVKYL